MLTDVDIAKILSALSQLDWVQWADEQCKKENTEPVHAEPEPANFDYSRERSFKFKGQTLTESQLKQRMVQALMSQPERYSASPCEIARANLKAELLENTGRPELLPWARELRTRYGAGGDRQPVGKECYTMPTPPASQPVTPQPAKSLGEQIIAANLALRQADSSGVDRAHHQKTLDYAERARQGGRYLTYDQASYECGK